MKSINYSISIKLPEKQDFEKGPFSRMHSADTIFERTWDLVVTTVSFIAASEICKVGQPAILGLAERLDGLRVSMGIDTRHKDWDRIKQLAGAMLCEMLTINGFKKALSPEKRRVNYPGFKVGQLYEEAE